MFRCSVKYRQKFESILNQTRPKNNTILPPRYEVTLAYGSRFEPWITSVGLRDDKIN